MNTTPLLKQFIIVSYFFLISSLVAMEPEAYNKAYADQVVALLPSFGTQHQNITPLPNIHSYQQFAQFKEFWYRQSFMSSNPLSALNEVQMPFYFERDAIKNGKTFRQKSSYQFALAHLAEGYLLEQQNNAQGAQNAFDRAYKLAGSKPQDQAVALAASFEQAYAGKLYSIAFEEMNRLKDISHTQKLFAPYQKLAQLQLQKLIDIEFMPALKLKADTGCVDTQYHLVEQAVLKACKQKTRDEYLGVLSSVAGYFDSLDVHPEFRPLIECVRLAHESAQAWKEQKRVTASEKLIKIMSLPIHGIEVDALKEMAVRQLGFAVKDGEFCARCYSVHANLESAHKATRVHAVEQARQLVLEVVSSDNPEYESLLLQYGILEKLKKFISSNPLASASCAQYYFKKLIVAKSHGDEVEVMELCKLVKSCAKIGERDGTTQKVSVNMLAYVQALEAKSVGNFQDAAALLIAIMAKAKKSQSFDRVLKEAARDILIDLKNVGAWKARCYFNEELFKAGVQCAPETIIATCEFALEMLEYADSEIFIGTDGAQLFARIQTLAKSGDPFSNYVAARMAFRAVHADRPEGLEVDNLLGIAVPLTYALGGIKYGEQAQLFTRALHTYKRIQECMLKHDYDQATQACYQLLMFELPRYEKTICHAFARTQLEACADKGSVSACAWIMGQSFESVDLADQQNAVMMGSDLFFRLMRLPSSSRTQEEWQKALQPFLEHGIVTKIENLHKNTQDAHLAFTTGALVSASKILQALTGIRLLAGSESLDPAVQLPLALEHASKLLKNSVDNVALDQEDCKLIMYPILGRCYFLLSQLSIDYGEFSQAIEFMQSGAQLDYAECLRANALWQLDGLHGTKINDRLQFDACIADLNKAYVLGDKTAGAILARYYSEGDSHKFPCGFSVDRDIKKAYTLAVATCSEEFPSSINIVACNEFSCALEAAPGMERPYMSNAIRLFIKSISLGFHDGYPSLVNIYKSPRVSDEHRKEITTFLRSEMQENNYMAHCALSDIALHIGSETVAYYHAKRAWELSNKEFGIFELIKVYMRNPEKYLVGQMIFEVAQHTQQLLGLTDFADLSGVFDKPQFLTQLLYGLVSLKDDKEYQLRAQEVISGLIAAMEKAGLKYTKIESMEDFNAQAASLGLVRVPVVQTDDAALEPPQEFKQSEAAQLLTADFLKGMQQIEDALEDMESSCAISFLEDALVYEMLIEAAEKENAQAAYLLSKICMHQAIKFTADPENCKKFLIQGVDVAKEACRLLPENSKYKSQFAQVAQQVLMISTRRFIPSSEYDINFFACVYALVHPILLFNKEILNELNNEDYSFVVRAAKDCLYALAAHGHIRSAQLYADLYLKSNDQAEQNKALEALYRNALALRKVDPKDAVRMGVMDLVSKYGPYVKDLADEYANSNAAMVSSYWMMLDFRKELGDKPFDLDAHNTAMSQADSYFMRAADGGCRIAQFLAAKKIIMSQEKVTKTAFNKAFEVIEMIAQEEPEAAEFLMDLYSGHYGELKCGHKIALNMEQAKKWADLIKDIKTDAWKVLARIANTQGNAAQLMVCKLEILKRKVHAHRTDLVQIAHDCVQLDVFPLQVKEYLEARAMENNSAALQGLGALYFNAKQYDKGVELLTEALANEIIIDGELVPSIHFELASAYLTHDWPRRNVEAAINHMTNALVLLGEHARTSTRLIGTMEGIACCLIRLLEEAYTHNDSDGKDTIATALEKVIDSMQEYELVNIHSLEHQLIMATQHCIKKSQFGITFKYLDKARMLLQQKLKIADVLQFKATASILVSCLREQFRHVKSEPDQEILQEQIGQVMAQLVLLEKKPSLSLKQVVRSPKRKVIKKRR